MRQMLSCAIVGLAICLGTNVAVADNHGHGDSDGGPYAASDTAAYYGSVGDSLHYGPPPPPVEVYEIIEEILSDDDELSNEATEMLEHLLEVGELREDGDPPPPLDMHPEDAASAMAEIADAFAQYVEEDLPEEAAHYMAMITTHAHGDSVHYSGEHEYYEGDLAADGDHSGYYDAASDSAHYGDEHEYYEGDPVAEGDHAGYYGAVGDPLYHESPPPPPPAMVTVIQDIIEEGSLSDDAVDMLNHLVTLSEPTDGDVPPYTPDLDDQEMDEALEEIALIFGEYLEESEDAELPPDVEGYMQMIIDDQQGHED